MHSQPDQAELSSALLAAPRQASPDQENGQPLSRHARPDWPPGDAATLATVPVSLLDAARERVAPVSAQPHEQRTAEAREQLAEIRRGARDAASWLETTHHYARLLNRDGHVPVTARFRSRDLAFLGGARENLIGFAELALRLIELHQPLDAGGISSDPGSPILRCRSCMWRWPCPSLRLILDRLDALRWEASPVPPGSS